MLAELAAEREQAMADQDRAQQRLASLTKERQAALQAHYADALPLDLLKQEMDRLTREMAETERCIEDATKTVDQLADTLQRALTVARRCHEHYEAAPPHVRRLLNQGFFSKLFIAQDGGVERTELTEPFATLLADASIESTEGAQGVPDAPGTAEAAEVLTTVSRSASGAQGANGRRPTDVLVRTFGGDHETPGDLVTGGSNVAGLVPAVGFEPTLSAT